MSTNPRQDISENVNDYADALANELFARLEDKGLFDGMTEKEIQSRFEMLSNTLKQQVGRMDRNNDGELSLNEATTDKLNTLWNKLSNFTNDFIAVSAEQGNFNFDNYLEGIRNLTADLTATVRTDDVQNLFAGLGLDGIDLGGISGLTDASVNDLFTINPSYIAGTAPSGRGGGRGDFA